MRQSTISAQVSVYPLRQAQLTPSVSKVTAELRAAGLEVRPGSMSTVVVGDADSVFDGLKASFQSAAALGDVVMVVSFSNCCPLKVSDQNTAKL